MFNEGGVEIISFEINIEVFIIYMDRLCKVIYEFGRGVDI